MLKKVLKLGELTLMKKYKEQERIRHTLVDLFWECTLTCNAHCKHCGSNAEKRKYEGELTTDEIKSAFKQIANDMDASKILINVTGGEPLVRKDLCEVMEYATNELGFRWGMTTNGILLNEGNIEKLKKANMETISISIDGLRETHDDFRGVPGSYDIIINNIKKLKEAGYVKHLQVTTVFNKKNIKQINELYDVMFRYCHTSQYKTTDGNLLYIDKTWEKTLMLENAKAIRIGNVIRNIVSREENNNYFILELDGSAEDFCYPNYFEVIK